MTGPMVHVGLQQLYTHAMGYRMLELDIGCWSSRLRFCIGHPTAGRQGISKRNKIPCSVSIPTSMSKKLDHILSLLIMHLTIVQIQCTSPH